MIHRQFADITVQRLQVLHVPLYTALVLVVLDVLQCRFPPDSIGPHPVNRLLADFFKAPDEVLLRLYPAARSSRLPKSSPINSLFDMPDPATEAEAIAVFRHDVSLHFWAGACPRRAIYSSSAASSSSRSKPIPCWPIGISLTNGRISSLNNSRPIPQYRYAEPARMIRGWNSSGFTLHLHQLNSCLDAPTAVHHQRACRVCGPDQPQLLKQMPVLCDHTGRHRSGHMLTQVAAQYRAALQRLQDLIHQPHERGPCLNPHPDRLPVTGRDQVAAIVDFAGGAVAGSGFGFCGFE